MFKFAVLSVLFVSALGAAIADGILPQLDGRYATGTSTNITRYPYVVSIQVNGYHYCSGSLYSRNTVITSARCLQDGFPVSQFKVRAGSTNWNSGGSLVSVASYIIHPKYSPATFANDIAIIKLSTALTLGSNIRTIALASSPAVNGSEAVFTGWGLGFPGISSSYNALQQAFVKIISKLNCTSGTYSYPSINDSMICTTPVAQNACLGDIGGALSDGFFLIGVASWDYLCAPGNYPGVYANVAALSSWIVENA